MSEKFDSQYAGLIASLDQFESMLRDVAPLFVTYYKALIKSGAPDELAQTLVLDYHSRFWNHVHRGTTED